MHQNKNAPTTESITERIGDLWTAELLNGKITGYWSVCSDSEIDELDQYSKCIGKTVGAYSLCKSFRENYTIINIKSQVYDYEAWRFRPCREL